MDNLNQKVTGIKITILEAQTLETGYGSNKIIIPLANIQLKRQKIKE